MWLILRQLADFICKLNNLSPVFMLSVIFCVILTWDPLNNSAQLCAIAAARALRGFRDGDDSLSPVFDVARYAIKPAS
jgi:hypothetical protein